MNARERLLTALDGGEPDRVPCALSFYHVDIERLAPPGQYHDGLVDVRFVRFPLSPEDEELGHRGRPFPPDTRLGTSAQVTTYARWSYRPQTPERRNPLALARSIGDAGIQAGGQAFGLWDAAAWAAVHGWIKTWAVNLLVVALAGVGLSTSARILRGLGIKPFLAGLGAALCVGGISYLLISLMGLFVPL